MRALRGLSQLVRVSQQDDVSRARRRGDHIRQRHLAGLVNEEIIEAAFNLRSREQPRRPGHQLDLARPKRVIHIRVAFRVLNNARGAALVGLRLLNRFECEPAALSLAAHCVQQIADYLVAERRQADAPTRD